MSQAKQWHSKFRLRACFRALVQHTRICRQLHLVVEHKSLALQLRAFTAWKAARVLRQHSIHNANVSRKRIDRSLLMQALWGWAQIARQRLLHITLVRRLQRRWGQRACMGVIGAWKQAVTDSRRRWELWEHVRMITDVQLQKQCMCAWWKVTVLLQLKRKHADFVLKMHASQSLHGMFLEWRHAVTQGQQLRQGYIQASSGRILALLARVWEAWQVIWMEGKRRRRAFVGAQAERRRRALSSAFRAWLHCSTLQKYQHLLLQGVLLAMSVMLSRVCSSLEVGLEDCCTGTLTQVQCSSVIPTTPTEYSTGKNNALQWFLSQSSCHAWCCRRVREASGSPCSVPCFPCMEGSHRAPASSDDCCGSDV